MTFRQASDATPHLLDKFEDGLAALRKRDKNHVTSTDTRRITGSVDVDTAYKRVPGHEGANRWDFAVGYQHTNRKAEVIYWIETHTGSDKEIERMRRKRAWLATWLKNEGKPLAKFEARYVWAPSGKTSFLGGALQVRKLALLGFDEYTGSKGLIIPAAIPEPKFKK